MTKSLRRFLRLWPLVLIGFFLWGLGNGQTGLPVWLRLERDLLNSEERIRDLDLSIENLEAEAILLRGDPYTLEAAIRTELKLALPGETIVILEPMLPRSPTLP